jgi:hypothetical protein
MSFKLHYIHPYINQHVLLVSDMLFSVVHVVILWLLETFLSTDATT